MIESKQAESLLERFSNSMKDFFSSQTSAALDQANKRADKAQSDLAAMKLLLDAEMASVIKLTAELATATKERDELKATNDPVKIQAEIATKAAKEAAAIAAAAGHKAVELKSSEIGGNMTEAQALEAFNAIVDPKERSAFYLKHFSPKFKS